MAVTALGGSGGGIKAYPDVYSKWKKPTLGVPGSESSIGAGPNIQTAAQIAAQLAAAGGAAGGGGGGGGGGGTPGGSSGAQVQLSPGVGSAISASAAELAALKAKGADPNLLEQIANYKARLSADTTGRAIDRAGSAISDRAAGMKSAKRTEIARRGAAGAGEQELGNIDQAAQREQAGSAAGISLGREKDLDALTIAGQGIMAAPGQMDFARQGQILSAIGQEGGLAGEQERIAQGWAGVGNEQRRTDIQATQAAQGQYLALMRLLMGGAYG